MRSTLLPLIFALHLVSGLPAYAAPPVTRDPTQPVLSHYDTAARSAGYSGWGSVLQNDDRIHVLLFARMRDQRLTILLPASVPITDAERWFAGLSDALGWKKVELSSTPLPTGTLLFARVRDPVEKLGLGRLRLRLSRDTLEQQLRKLTPLPVHLVVRTSAPEVAAVHPEPTHRSRLRNTRFLFYAPSASNAPASQGFGITYGVTDRWRLAFGSLLACWAALPTLVLFGVREQLRRDAHQTPKERFRAFQRWVKPVWLVTLIGAIVTPFLLSIPQMAYAIASLPGDIAMAWSLVALAVPTTWALAPALLLGEPLAQAASDDGPQQSARRPVIVGAVLLNALPFLLAFTGEAITGTIESFPLNGLKLVATLAFAGFGVMFLTRWVVGRKQWSLRATGVPPGEALATPELAADVARISQQVGAPVTRVLVTDLAVPGAVAPSVSVRGSVALVYCPLTERLTTEQIAALIAADARGEVCRPLAQWCMWVVGIGMFTWGVLGVLWLLVSSRANVITPTPLQMAPILIGFPVSAVLLMIDEAITRRLKEDADVRVADAVSSPEVLLEALRFLETERIGKLKLDPVALDASGPITRRRITLLRRLGLDDR